MSNSAERRYVKMKLYISLLSGKGEHQKEGKPAFDSVRLGTKPKQMLSRDLAVQSVKEKGFKLECTLTVLQILKKLKERNPLIYSMLPNASSVDPSEIAANKNAAILNFNSLAERFSKLGILFKRLNFSKKLHFLKNVYRFKVR